MGFIDLKKGFQKKNLFKKFGDEKRSLKIKSWEKVKVRIENARKLM